MYLSATPYSPPTVRSTKIKQTSSSRIRQILPLQLPPHPRHPIIPHNPKLRQSLSNPRKILHRIISLHPRNQHSIRIQNIHTRTRTRQDVTVSRDFKAIGHPVLGQPDGAFAGDVRAVVDAVVLVHCAGAGLVPGAAWRAILQDGAGDSACVGDVDVLAVGREGDAVGLLEGVVDDGDGAGGGVEAVGGWGQLGRGVGEAVEPGVFRVGEPDGAGFVDEEVVDAVEVVAEVVVEEGDGFVGVGVEGSDAGALFGSADGVVAAGGRWEILA